MAQKRYLFTPGPTPVPPEVLAALAEPVLHHRAPDFREVYARVLGRLKEVHRTESEVLLFTASGTGAFESAIVSLCSPGERVLAVSAGSFGERWSTMARTFGCEVEELRYEWGETPSPEDLNRKLGEIEPVSLVFLVHSETSTGVVADVQALGAVAKEAGALVVVDAVSSLGAVPLEGGVETLLQQEAERDVEGDDQRDGRREGCVELRLRGAGPLPVEVEARQGGARDLLPRGRRDRRGGEAGRRHQRLLRAGDHDVEAPLVQLERHGAEARDRVDDDERARLLRDRRERLDVGDDTRRGLGLDEKHERDRLDPGQLERELVGGGCLPPFVAKLLDLAAEGACHGRPALAEIPGRDGEHPLAGRAQVHDRRLEGARARAGEEEHVRLRAVHLLEAPEHAGVHLAEVRRAVVEDRFREGGQHLGRHRGRPGREQVPLVRHRAEVTAAVGAGSREA